MYVYICMYLTFYRLLKNMSYEMLVKVAAQKLEEKCLFVAIYKLNSNKVL